MIRRAGTTTTTTDKSATSSASSATVSSLARRSTQRFLRQGRSWTILLIITSLVLLSVLSLVVLLPLSLIHTKNNDDSSKQRVAQRKNEKCVHEALLQEEGAIDPPFGVEPFSHSVACQEKNHDSFEKKATTIPRDSRLSRVWKGNHSTTTHHDTGHQQHHRQPYKNQCTIYHPFIDLESLVTRDDASIRHHSLGFLPPQEDAQQQQDELERDFSWHFHNNNETTAPWADVAVLTRRGFGVNHEINQDRAVIVYPFLTFSPTEENQNDFFMGIFDGHGDRGHVVSHFTSVELPKLLAFHLQQQQQQQQQQQRASFHKKSHGGKTTTVQELSTETVKSSLLTAFQTVHSCLPSTLKSGTTASISVRLGSKLYIANVGDSRTIVVRHRTDDDDNHRVTADIIYESRQDKPHIQEERVRIEGMGGQVYVPPLWALRESSRVISLVDGEILALAMSRSIGDHQHLGLIAEPIIDVIDLKDDEHMSVISMTDGLFDEISVEEIVTRLAPSLGSYSPRHPMMMMMACNEIIQDAALRWSIEEGMFGYRDDITIAIKKI